LIESQVALYRIVTIAKFVTQSRRNHGVNSQVICLSGIYVYLHCSSGLFCIVVSIHCALSLAAQCIVIGPVCGFVCLWVCLFVCLFVCGSLTTITRNCVHRSSPNWVCRSPAD